MNICLTTKVWANTISFLTKDSSNNYCRYEYNAIMDSAENKILGDSSALFDEYSKNQPIAFEDNKNGYVDYNFVMEEALNYSLDNKIFNLDECLNKDGKKHVINKPESIIDVYEIDGKVIKQQEEFDVKRIY